MRASSSSFLRQRLPYVVVAAMGLMAHIFLARPLYAMQDRIMAWVVLCFLLMATRQYALKDRREPPIWLMIAVQYYVVFGLPQFSQVHIKLIWGSFAPSASMLSWTYCLVVLSEIALFVSARISGRVFGGVGARLWALAPDIGSISSRSIKIYAMFALIVWYVATLRAALVPRALMAPMLAAIDPILALILLLYCQFARQKEQKIPWGTAMAVIMAFVGLLQGVMENIVVPFFLLALIAWIYGRKIKARTLVIVLLAFVILNPIKSRYRAIVWDKTFPGGVAGITKRLETWSDAAIQFFKEPFAGAEAAKANAGRISGIIEYSEVLEMVPTPIPYRRGKSLLTAMSYFIPRVFWHGKPGSSDIIYNEYAVEFGFSTQEGTRTSTTGTNFLAEGYWDWGALGSVAYASALAALLAMLFGGKGNRVSEGQVLIASAFLGKVFQILIPFSVFLAMLFSFCVGSLIALWGLALASGGVIRRGQRDRHHGS